MAVFMRLWVETTPMSFGDSGFGARASSEQVERSHRRSSNRATAWAVNRASSMSVPTGRPPTGVGIWTIAVVEGNFRAHIASRARSTARDDGSSVFTIRVGRTNRSPGLAALSNSKS